MDVKNKKVLVVGLGISGQAAARLLLDRGAEVSITEIDDTPELQEISKKFILQGVAVELGRNSEQFVEGHDLIITSPGVNSENDIFRWSKKYNIPLISEIEFAGSYIDCPMIAITGTNGKSTVTSLIAHIFNCAGKNAVACGNIGFPLSSVVLEQGKFDFAIVEVSSFQLEYITDFRPDTAVFLNFSCDHIDSHKSMERYLIAKLNIFKNQIQQDNAVIRSKDFNLIKNAIKSQIVFYDNNDPQTKQFMSGITLNIQKENIQAAYSVARIYSIELDKIRDAIESFQPLPHRMEYVTDVNGVNFINDSKATNVASVNACLSAIKGPVVLILGGRDKGDDFSELKNAAIKKVKSIIAVGEAKEKIQDQLSNSIEVEKAIGFKEAVVHASKIAPQGGTVVLSPGCSSFDMFKDYKERGEIFKKCVLDLAKHKEVGFVC